MEKYKRMTLSQYANKGEVSAMQETLSNDENRDKYLRNCELRLTLLEDKIERGELVFTEEEQYRKRQWIKSAARVMCCCKCDAENCNYQCSYKDSAERLYEARECRI